MNRSIPEAEVVVAFIVGQDGHVEEESIDVVRASDREFRDAAKAMITDCRFRPGALGGEPVRVRMTLPVNFKLAPRRPPPNMGLLPTGSVVLAEVGSLRRSEVTSARSIAAHAMTVVARGRSPVR